MDWIATRTPPAPEELKAWLKIPDGGSDSMPESLLRGGVLHLEAAAGRPGRDREAAYQLLAADALITYGCEAASEVADVRAVLREVLVRVSAGGALA